MPTLLTWRLGALGDTLLLLPALAALRAAFPAHDLLAAGQPAALAPALWDGLADGILDATSARLAPLLGGAPPAAGTWPGDVDLAVVWSAHHAAIAQGLARAGVARVVAAPALPSTRKPVALHYLDTLAPLGIAPVAYHLRAPVSARAATAAAWNAATGLAAPAPGGKGETHPAEPGAEAARAVLLHPGAGSPLKRWPLRNYLALARDLRRAGIAVVWTAGPADAAVRMELDSAGEGAALLPPLDVAGLAAVLERAAVVVSGDCGIAHLAALLAVPTVTLFGPTDPHVWGPLGARGTVVHLALPCAPCGEIARACPSRICLRALPVAAVRRAVQAHLHGATAQAHRAGVTREIEEGEKIITGAGGPSAGTARRPAPLRPSTALSPAQVPGPPAPLQVARWAGARTWRTRGWTEP